jgi:hypothetical protein
MWPFRRKRKTSSIETPPPAMVVPSTEPDDPFGFGFKNSWWALPTPDTEVVIDAIRLQNSQPANWQTGIQYAYERSVFVTPPIDKWTLIAGFYLPPMSQKARDEVISPLLELSEKFGMAFVFATHRIVGYHIWAKAVAGSLIRGYGYSGESMVTFWDEGPMTPEERELGFAFFDERSLESKNDSYWDRKDLTTPNETNVMDIARKWSVAPFDLDDYKPSERKLGVLGSHSELLKCNADNST